MDGSDRLSDLFSLADLVEEWGAAVPRWNPTAGERWDRLAQRRYEAEQSLRSRLRRLPTCVLRTSPLLTDVDFSLAGIRVEGCPSLDAACRAWAAEARRLAGG
ncbi:hypothetical protein [Rubellimicrobium roseum]|uniref:Uncharacterized protein n=1 Tax=Rubellimicrobium roseum TaxID=687525 RepID=A0A5C4NA74_9RHOB|nr:hypothetical protein [Rubellimicrobium roseum]TNC68507.1 hypothetical protein FHG71_14575 [Rubellimicrobium roseum]